MAKSKSNDAFQIVILTLFMVSGFLVVVNLYFANECDKVRQAAERAVKAHTMLKKELLDESLRRLVAEERRLKSMGEEKKTFVAEINERAERELGVIKTYAPVKKTLGGYVQTRKKIDAPIKTHGQTFVHWMSYLGRIESDRPDIHVEDITLRTEEFEVPAEGKRMWGGTVNFVHWVPEEK